MQRRQAALFVGLASAAFVVVGALMRGGVDAWVVGAAAAAGALLLLAIPRAPIAGVLAVAAGLVAEASAIHARHDLGLIRCPEGTLGCPFVPPVSDHVIWGADIAIVASSCFILAAALSTVISGDGVSLRLPPSPPTTALVLWVVVGVALFWLFAFTLVGIAGEVLVFLAGLVLLARGVSSLVRR